MERAKEISQEIFLKIYLNSNLERVNIFFSFFLYYLLNKERAKEISTNISFEFFLNTIMNITNITFENIFRR